MELGVPLHYWVDTAMRNVWNVFELDDKSLYIPMQTDSIPKTFYIFDYQLRKNIKVRTNISNFFLKSFFRLLKNTEHFRCPRYSKIKD